MHKSYKKTVAILITCALISSLCIPVSAASYDGVYSVPIQQPPCDTEYGYIEWLYLTGSGTVNVAVTLFSLIPSNQDNNQAYIFISATNTSATLTVTHNDPLGSASAYFYTYRADGSSKYEGSVLDSSLTLSFNQLYGVHVYGPTTFIQSSSFSSQPNWSVAYGVDSYSYSALLNILAAIKSQSNSDIINNANQNASDIQQNADKNASDIQQNDDENTQAIIDNQNDLAEQEKQEITDSGNQATDAGDSIPNESDGFIDALGTFVDTMSTTSTECSLTFPAIKIPSFAGIPATTLSEEREVDISAAVGLIPEDIMKLIQALTTIALIVFCFKELYDTISEALTRKKANADG